MASFPAATKACFRVSGIYIFGRDIFQNEEFMEA
jgi:hypothetical protein